MRWFFLIFGWFFFVDGFVHLMSAAVDSKPALMPMLNLILAAILLGAGCVVGRLDRLLESRHPAPRQEGAEFVRHEPVISAAS